MSYRRRDGFYHLDFQSAGRRYRVSTGLPAIDDNEALIKDWDATIRREIKLGTFRFENHFPKLRSRTRQPVANATYLGPVSLNKVLGPCAYVITDPSTDLILYVGMSARGISRIGSINHSGILKCLNHFAATLKIHFCETIEEAANLETDLILKHRPKYNSTVDLKYINRENQATKLLRALRDRGHVKEREADFTANLSDIVQ